MENEVFIYLARLDKKGIKAVSSFRHSAKVYPTKIDDVSSLGLSPDLAGRVSKEAYENRMHYELYLESAPSFEELKNALRSRGYANLPGQNFSGDNRTVNFNERAVVTSAGTMMRRGSEITTR